MWLCRGKWTTICATQSHALIASLILGQACACSRSTHVVLDLACVQDRQNSSTIPTCPFEVSEGVKKAGQMANNILGCVCTATNAPRQEKLLPMPLFTAAPTPAWSCSRNTPALLDSHSRCCYYICLQQWLCPRESYIPSQQNHSQVSIPHLLYRQVPPTSTPMHAI